MPNIIRKPRFLITKKPHRFVGFKVGDYVWYRFRGYNLLKVTEIEDCYDWNRKRRDENGNKIPRKQYSRYIWTKPVKRKNTARLRQTEKDVMQYNNRIWKSGYIGHGIDYNEVFHTKGEAMHDRMSYYEWRFKIMFFGDNSYIGE